MDNLYFKKLPSNALPSVSGNDVVLVETDSGDFVLIDSNGAKTLLNVDKAFPVGTVLCRANDISPASDIGGTWQKIAEGQTIIGASTDYPLNSTGGEREHIHDAGDIVAQIMGGGSYLQYVTKGTDEYAMEYSTNIPNGTEIEISTIRNLGVPTIGSTAQSSNMQPYLALNIWKKIAN